MQYIGVDPGAINTGVAVYEVTDGVGRFTQWTETNNPTAVFPIIEGCRKNGEVMVVLEDFLGSGYRDKNITRTIKIVGYVQYRCEEFGIPYELVPQHKRLSAQVKVPGYIRGKDEFAAACHALAYHEREERSDGDKGDKGKPSLRGGPPSLSKSRQVRKHPRS